MWGTRIHIILSRGALAMTEKEKRLRNKWRVEGVGG